MMETQENTVIVSISTIKITQEDYKKIKSGDEDIRITIKLKKGKGTCIFFGKEEGNMQVWKESIYLETKSVKVSTEKEIEQYGYEAMEIVEQQEKEKCKKCQEQKQ